MSHPHGITHLDLEPADVAAIEDLLASLTSRGSTIRSPDLLSRVSLTALRQLPPAAAEALWCFRSEMSGSGLLIRGLPIDDGILGPTPGHWRRRSAPDSTLREELYLLLVASALGDVFAWSTLQQGRLVQDVLPIQGEEDQQSGHGSVSLEWHTEDAFHPLRCDYLALLCLRNRDGVPTTFSSIDSIQVDDHWTSILRQPRFLIRPDNEHLRQAGEMEMAGRKVMQEMCRDPEPSPVLFGEPGRPYLRIDPFFMAALPGDQAAAAALSHVVRAIDTAISDIALAPGELLIIDNYRAVHGRRPYRPSFDGGDRWLKKALVTRDLRKSRDARGCADDRVVA
jgi:L-asparagine oxygenase